MSGSTENQAPGASEKASPRSPVLSLSTARRMLPLVQQIVADILHNQRLLTQLTPERDKLDGERRLLDWPQRQRRYQLREDIAAADRNLHEALAEFEGLGLTLVIPQDGLVGFPTVVNGRKAFFSWKPGEDSLKYWHFVGDSVRRKIPAGWVESDESRLVGKS